MHTTTADALGHPKRLQAKSSQTTVGDAAEQEKEIDERGNGSRGARVKAHDYKGMENMKAVFKDAVEWCHDPVTAAAGADAVALVTDWPQYTTLPFRKISATMNTPIIFDGRNCLHRDVMRESGFQYFPMGRPPVENKLRLKTRA